MAVLVITSVVAVGTLVWLWRAGLFLTLDAFYAPAFVPFQLLILITVLVARHWLVTQHARY